ncbi:MAG: hypothetical protein CM1200mP9_03950 [Gammaproteobacteria bacterium]|nr:MAG: hypothetical protein CM1200mP9_03950 [Gammaproteobacteria bacterium]
MGRRVEADYRRWLVSDQAFKFEFLAYVSSDLKRHTECRDESYTREVFELLIGGRLRLALRPPNPIDGRG